MSNIERIKLINLLTFGKNTNNITLLNLSKNEMTDEATLQLNNFRSSLTVGIPLFLCNPITVIHH